MSELLVAHQLQHPQDLKAEEYRHRTKLLERLQRCPTDYRHLKGAEGAHGKEDRVGGVEGVVELAVEEVEEGEDSCVHAYHVEDEDVAAPCSDHVKVTKASDDADRPPARTAEREKPEVKGGADSSHGHTLVVVAASH
jgi:hypothetical protein